MGSTTPGDQIVTALVSIITALSSTITTAAGGAVTVANIATSINNQGTNDAGHDSHGKGSVVQGGHRHPGDIPD